ncbi:MAG: orotidine-5'-phosphate decarboxylase [Planctomycetia bacterium]
MSDPSYSAPFAERLCEAVRLRRTPAMVGVDPFWEQLPDEVRTAAVAEFGETPEAMAAAFETFGAAIIDVAAGVAPIVKFQMACYEKCGPAGMTTLAVLSRRAQAAGLLVCFDGKRNDIGHSAEQYAAGYLGTVTVGATTTRVWGADSLTVNPYLGSEGIEPFVKTAVDHHAGLYVLVRTSNPSAGKLQDLAAGDRLIYETIADWVEEWSVAAAGGFRYGPVGAVAGATVPRQLTELRRRMPHVPLLVPGYGAQGAGAAETAGAFDADGHGAVVNSSRGILYAYKQKEYADLHWKDAAKAALAAMTADLAAHTPAGNLR